MADIELVIKISEKVYNALTRIEFDANLVVNEMRKSIANGTPLPDTTDRDLISRQAVLDTAKSSKSNWIDNSVLFKRVNELPPVTPHETVTEFSDRCRECGREKVVDKIRAEIDQKQYDFMDDGDYDEGIRFGLMLAYQIVNKYKVQGRKRGVKNAESN